MQFYEDATQWMLNEKRIYRMMSQIVSSAQYARTIDECVAVNRSDPSFGVQSNKIKRKY